MSRFISIICPVYNEERYIAGCLDSILASEWPHESMEILLIDGGSTDRTREIIGEYTSKYNFIRLLDNPRRIVPAAMNIGIRASRGTTLIRIDAHSLYPPDYITVLVRALYDLNADNVGAVWNTIPADDSAKCRAIATVSSHAFGIGNSLHKTGIGKVTETDTVPYGCYPRRVFDEIGLYDEDLVLNQDDELNGRIVKNGGRIFLIPEITIEYTARPTLKKMAHMYWGYGLFKPVVNKKLGRPATWRQFIPPLFIAGLVAGAALSFVARWLFYVYICIVAIYALSSIAVSVREAARYKRWQLLFLLPWTFLVAHMSYGAGYWTGLFTVLSGRIPKFRSKR